MSRTTELTKTYSGVFGNHVELKSRKGKSTITIPPTKVAPVLTEKQTAHRKKFLKAVKYAKEMMKNPDLLALYSENLRKGKSAFALAVKDYMKSPVVEQIEVLNYQGNPGDLISVSAEDDFKLTAVSVQIIDPAGEIIEQGVCAISLPTGHYDYTATELVPDLTGVTIKAKALDLPGHAGELAITL